MQRDDDDDSWRSSFNMSFKYYSVLLSSLSSVHHHHSQSGYFYLKKKIFLQTTLVKKMEYSNVICIIIIIRKLSSFFLQFFMKKKRIEIILNWIKSSGFILFLYYPFKNHQRQIYGFFYGLIFSFIHSNKHIFFIKSMNHPFNIWYISIHILYSVFFWINNNVVVCGKERSWPHFRTVLWYHNSMPLSMIIESNRKLIYGNNSCSE